MFNFYKICFPENSINAEVFTEYFLDVIIINARESIFLILKQIHFFLYNNLKIFLGGCRIYMFKSVNEMVENIERGR